ncbi:MAG: polysaccharide biosynthesis tyrosine autokinase [Cyanobacteria bacterium P01_A01_bin.84]
MDSDIQLDEFIDFQKYWLVLKRRWIPATATFATIVALGLLKALSEPKIYEAQAKLLVKSKDQTVALTGLDSSTGEIKGLTQESDPLITEGEIVRSRPIIEKLIKELDLKDDEGQLFKYDYLAEAISVNPIPATDILEVKYASEDPEFSALVVNKVSELYLEDHNLNNRSRTAAANKFIAQQLPQVEAEVRKAESRLRDFKLKNGISSLEQETSANIDSITGNANRIDEIEAELDNVNASYQQLQAQLNMGWQEAAAVSSLSESMPVQRVLEQLQEVKVTLAQKQNYLSSDAPQIISLKEEQADLNALLEQEIAKTLNDKQQALVENVNILSLGELKRSQIANLAELGLRKTGLEQELKTQKKIRRSYQQKSSNLPRLQERQRDLERRVEVVESTYQNLLTRLQQTRISEQQNTGNVRIISEAAVPEAPLPSKKKLIVAGSGVMGVLLGIFVAFLLDLRDQTIKNTLEIGERLSYPLIGFIPDYKKVAHHRQLMIADSSGADVPELIANQISVLPIGEAYQELQINLQLLCVQEAFNKVVLITSALSGEGKSSVAANLAAAKSQCGQKVLLVDADLRYPAQSRLWSVSNNVGLAHILDREVPMNEWYSSVHQVVPNLDLITSGETSKQPISLLNSPLLEEFIINAAEDYDCIIVDSPPLVGLSDTKILSRVADGLLLVVRPGVANYGSLTTTKKILETKDFNVLAIVANGVDFAQDPYSRDYYHHNKKYLEPNTAS